MQTKDSWLPVLCLSLSAFIFVTTEMLPIGLLPDIAQAFQRSEAATGPLLTIYAWMVALMSLPLTIATARMDRRKLSLGLLLFFACGHFFAAASTSYAMLVASRISIALCHAIFWSITTPLVTRIAPGGMEARALSMIVTATSIAMILGVPIGTFMGHYWGWRMTFGLIGGLALLIFLFMFRILPPQPSSNSGSLKSVPMLFHRREIVVVYIVTMLTVTGHFLVSTYFTPYMSDLGAFDRTTVAFLLLVFGASGIIGSWVGAKYVDSRPEIMLVLPLVGVAASLFLLVFISSGGILAASALCFLWGASMTCAGLIFQTRILRAAPEARDVAVSMYSGIYISALAAALSQAALYLPTRGYRRWALPAASAFWQRCALCLAHFG